MKLTYSLAAFAVAIAMPLPAVAATINAPPLNKADGVFPSGSTRRKEMCSGVCPGVVMTRTWNAPRSMMLPIRGLRSGCG